MIYSLAVFVSRKADIASFYVRNATAINLNFFLPLENVI